MCCNDSWIEEATEVVAEGIGMDWKRYRAAVVPMQESYDFKPEGEAYVPAIYAGNRYGGSFDSPTELNGYYMPGGPNEVMRGVLELRDRHRHDDWQGMAARYLRIFHGAIGARVSEVRLDQSDWGIMVAAYGQEWLDMTGADRTALESAEWSEDFEGWLRGDVSELELQSTEDGETWERDEDADTGIVIYGHADLKLCKTWAEELWPDHFITDPTKNEEAAA